ncbi:MAG: parallel beta-helix domain-containing protein [Myxococcota bacterium]
MDRGFFVVSAVVGLLVLAAGCGDGGSSTVTCGDVEGNCVFLEEGDDLRERLQGALLEATEGTTIILDEGTYAMDMEVSHQGADGIAIRGQGRDRTILDFSGQSTGGGIVVENVTGITVEGLSVMNPAADGVVVRASTDVVLRDLRVEWDPAVDSDNGLYAIYPVNSEDVLVENVIAIGSSDAGIYVGESRNVIVRDCEAHHNVAGIQMENSFDSEMYDNWAHDNAAGLMIFDLPGKEFQKNGGRHLVYDNLSENNNTENFATGGAIVATLPSGMGGLVMAVDDVELRNNTFRNNETVNLAVVSFYIAGDPSEDPEFDPIPERIYIHDNEFEGGGDSPDTTKDGGMALAALNAVLNSDLETPGEPIRDIAYDGISPEAPVEGTPDAENNPAYVCFEDNADADGDADFLYLDGDNIDVETADISEAMPHDDVGTFTCTGPTQSDITLP